MGEYLIKSLSNYLKDCSKVKNIRGHGLMIGIELDQPCRELVRSAVENGILLNVTSDSVIRLLPPLIIDEKIADEITLLVTKTITG